MSNPQIKKPSLTREYWTYNVGEPTGPVAQFRMAQLVDYDTRLTDPARTVYRFLIGWYMRSNGDALASVRHIVATMRARAPDGARHLSRSAVQRAIILLIETGWLIRTYVGKGRGASRFVPVLNVLELATQGTLPAPEINSVPLHRDTNEDGLASHSTGTALSHSTGTLTDVASHLPGQRPSYTNPSTDGVTCKEDNDCTAPLAPLSAGLTAADAETVQGGKKDLFDDLYRIYDVRGEKAAARRAYEKIAPSPEKHAEMIEAARAWKAAAGNIERMQLRRWIEEERYDEDPKGERKPRAQKAGAKQKPQRADPPPEPDNDDIPEFMIGSPSLWPVGHHVGEFVDGNVEVKGPDTEVMLTFRVTEGKHAGEEYRHRFYSQAFVERYQEEGQAIIRDIITAVELDELSDTDELLYKPLHAFANGKTIGYTRRFVKEAA